jgi:hypothetical protein
MRMSPSSSASGALQQPNAPERKDVEQDRVDVVSHGEEGVFATVTAGRSARKRIEAEWRQQWPKERLRKLAAQ